METEGSEGGGIFSRGDNVGWNVITPFKLSDRPDQTILVNRGWVPKKKLKPETRAEAQVEGEHVLTGVVRTSEARSQFMLANKINSNMFGHR